MELTEKQVELLDCAITDLGISFRTAELLEKQANVVCVRDMLTLSWEDMRSLGGFGRNAEAEVREALVDSGFLPAEHLMEGEIPESIADDEEE